MGSNLWKQVINQVNYVCVVLGRAFVLKTASVLHRTRFWRSSSGILVHVQFSVLLSYCSSSVLPHPKGVLVDSDLVTGRTVKELEFSGTWKQSENFCFVTGCLIMLDITFRRSGSFGHEEIHIGRYAFNRWLIGINRSKKTFPAPKFMLLVLISASSPRPGVPPAFTSRPTVARVF